MSVKNKCKVVLLLGFLIMLPGIISLVVIDAPIWVIIVNFGTFWLGGALFVIAMMGDGEVGLGIKSRPHKNRY